MVVTKRADNSGVRGFGKPEALDLQPDFHHAILSRDAKTMYLQGPLGLFVSRAGKEGWSKPEALEALNNAEGPTGDRSPNLSRDGSMLSFASDRPGGKGGLERLAGLSVEQIREYLDRLTAERSVERPAATLEPRRKK